MLCSSRALTGAECSTSKRCCLNGPGIVHGHAKVAQKQHRSSLRLACLSEGAEGRSSEPAARAAVPDALPLAGPDADWREFRARLVASNRSDPQTIDLPLELDPSTSSSLSQEWAHELPWPERGCVLLAHPSLFANRQTYFHQAVILLLDHGGPEGSYGVILNRPTQYRMGQIKSSVTQLLSCFSDNRLYMGGDVGDSAMVVVTRRGDIAGRTEVTRGLYHHNVHAAQQAVESGVAEPSDFRFFAQYAGWAPGQLAQECRRGVWYCAAASPALVLNEELAQGPSLWHRVLQVMGGDHARVSEIVRGAEKRDAEKREGEKKNQGADLRQGSSMSRPGEEDQMMSEAENSS